MFLEQDESPQVALSVQHAACRASVGSLRLMQVRTPAPQLASPPSCPPHSLLDELSCCAACRGGCSGAASC